MITVTPSRPDEIGFCLLQPRAGRRQRLCRRICSTISRQCRRPPKLIGSDEIVRSIRHDGEEVDNGNGRGRCDPHVLRMKRIGDAEKSGEGSEMRRRAMRRKRPWSPASDVRKGDMPPKSPISFSRAGKSMAWSLMEEVESRSRQKVVVSPNRTRCAEDRRARPRRRSADYAAVGCQAARRFHNQPAVT